MFPNTTTTTNTQRPKVITVYAGSASAVDPTFKQHAFQIGKLIAQEGWIQLNGGGYSGLMGAATQGAFSVGGTVDCVILDKFVDSNLSNGFRNIRMTTSMTDRKNGLSLPADAFIALPGGLGTLDELAEVMCMRQLSFHQKPIVILNTNRYYQGLHQYIETAIQSNFVAQSVKQVVHFADTPEQALHFLKTYKPIPIDKHALYSKEMEAASNIFHNNNN